MSNQTIPDAGVEFRDSCKRLVASLALAAAESMPIEKRIMVNHGIADLFAPGTPEHEEAKHTAFHLASAEKRQLQLTRLLNS